MDLFRADLIRDGGKALALAEGLGVGDQLDGAGRDDMDVDDFALRDVDVDGRVDVDEVVSGENRGLKGFLDAVHGVFGGPFLRALTVFEPGAAVVDGDNDGTGEVHPLGLETDEAGEVLLRHARIAAVAVDLVEGRREIDGGVVALGGAQAGADDGRGVRAGRENGARDACFRPEGVNAVEEIFGFCHNILYI